MPRLTPVQTSFTAGEISPRLQARFDLDAYYNGAAKLVNFVCLPHGPIIKRQGTTFIAEAGSKDPRLIPFKFSVTQSMVLEFGEHYIRFYFKGGQLTNPDGTPYQITSPYSEAQAKEIDFAQSGNTIFIVHPRIAPQKLVRYGNTNWTITPETFVAQPENWTDNNWPSHVVFHEQRLYYANTPNRPQTIWATRIGLFNDFTMKSDSDDVLDDHAIEYTISSDEVNGIQWMKAVNTLACGTSGAEYSIHANYRTDSITPKNIRVSRQTSYGSLPVRVQQIGSGLAFVQRGGTRVRIFEYGYVEDQYTSVDVTMMSEHILSSGVKEMDLQTVQDPYIWCVLNDGSLVGLSYEKSQKVQAWHRHIFPNGRASSICIIPGGVSDEVWLVMKRTINGVEKTYIESFLDAFSEISCPQDGYFMDSHLYYEGDLAIDQIGGLDHLEGQEVAVLVDGWVHPKRTVTRGSITLQTFGNKIVVGIPFEAQFESCQIQSSDSVIMGHRKRVYSAEISMLQSLGMKIGVKGYPEQEVFMGPTKVMNKAQDLYTGTISVKVPASSEDDTQVYVHHDMPLPCEVRAIKYDIEVNQ